MGDSIKTINEIKGIQNRFPEYGAIDCFIETGTYKGCTINLVSKYFSDSYTIELCENLHQGAIKRAESLGISNINFIQGDSADELPILAENIDKPAIFFLDGHFCGTGRGSIKSDKGIPLFEELKSINKRNYNDIVIVDDVKIFGKTLPGRELFWGDVTINNILECFDEDKIKFSFVNNDRFVIYLQQK